MTAPDNYSLNFSSSPATPLACMKDTAITLGQFRQDVEQLAALLTTDGDTLISCTGRYAVSVGLLASWLSNKTVLLPPNHRDETLLEIRTHFNVAFECDTSWARTLASNNDARKHGSWDVQLSAELLAARLFTSGSTGTPRVITKSIANLFDEVNAIASEFNWPAGPVVAGVPAQHLYGLTFSVLLPWVLGHTWVDDMPHYPRDVLQVLQQVRGKILISVPAQYQAMLENRTELHDILCISAAAPLPDHIARQWQQHYGAAILEIYGSTETGVVAHRKQSSTSAWQAFPQTSLSMEQGRLKVISPFVSDEFSHGFLTADRVVLQEHGCFELLGRTDTVIKIAGKRVSLTHIETTLNALPGVAEAAVIAVPAKGVVRDIAIWAAVVASGEQPPSPRQLQTALRGKLDGIEVPRRILFVDQLPRTPSGKLPHSALTDLFEEHDASRVLL